MALLFVPGTFALLGLTMIVLALRTFAKDRAIRGWPRVPAVVTKSFLESHRSTYDDPQGLRQSTTIYTPVVHFTYTVDGRQFEGTRLARSVSSSERERAQARIAPYTVGAPVMVLCDPADPSTAYLEVHRSLGAIILLCFGCVLIAPAVVVWSVALLR
ncbi:MAG: DUF3592 domain-containing protein [Myxococcales bacterium]|nr:DUF3592 domain-containing protein [Myxococcales bacterium]